VIKPTLGNQLLWRVTYLHEGLIYTDAVRTGLWGSDVVLEGESKPLVRVEKEFASLQGTALFDSLLRFSRLSEGFLVFHPGAPNVLGDARYAMLPTSLSPLWGLEFDPKKPDQAVRFLTFRDAGVEVRQLYFDMLFRPLELSSVLESPRSSDPPAPPEIQR
jgi:inner membrane protein